MDYSDSADEHHQDLQLSESAMRLVFLARFDEALHSLSKSSRKHHKHSSGVTVPVSQSLSLSATHSFICFTQALVTYETSKIQQGLNLWKQTEKLCAASKNNSLEDKLEQRVIVADAKICNTFLQLLQSADFGGLFKGGWSIRQAWKLYQSSYEDILKLIDTESKSGKLSSTQVNSLLTHLPAHKNLGINGNGSSLSSSSTSQKSGPGNGADEENDCDEDGDEFVDALSEFSTNDGSSLENPHVQFRRLHQIMGSVCYGYGCFHLMLSLLPASLLKWLKFLGFDGDLQTGIQALTYSMNSPDSKALLARITLIWFHVIIQTYYAVHETEMEQGIEQASILLNAMDSELRASPFIRFFDCRLKRFRKDIDGAIASYISAQSSSVHVKEINVLVHHEFGILRFQLRQWDLAMEHLSKCFHEGRWGKSLYAYLMGICSVMMNDAKKGRELIGQVSSLNVMKNAPLEMFLAERSTQVMKEPLSSFPSIASVLGMELTYFLNCPQYVPDSVSKSMLKALDDVKSSSYLGLRWLIHGRLMEAEQKPDQAIQSYREAVRLGENIKGSEHVPAFACYELGVLLSRNQQTSGEGKKLLQQASDFYKSCHFRNRLHVRIHLAKKAFGQ